KKPNDLGLFDVHGNVWQWCQDPSFDYPEAWGKPLPDVEDRTPVADLLPRVARGGSFLERPETLRSGLRRHAYPSSRDPAVRFPLGRTFRRPRRGRGGGRTGRDGPGGRGGPGGGFRPWAGPACRDEWKSAAPPPVGRPEY